MATGKTIIEVPKIVPATVTVTIRGTSDLVMNKMNDYTKRTLTAEREDKAKSLEKPNKWEQITTGIHWLHGKPEGLRPEDYTEETLRDKLQNDSPCFTSFGMMKQMCKAIVRYKIDKYSTVFAANVKIVTQGNGLIPFKFAEHFVDEEIRTPKRGAPILARTNRFSGWSAEIQFSFIESIIGVESLINILNQTGFNIGIGSGTTSGFGMFEVTDVH